MIIKVALVIIIVIARGLIFVNSCSQQQFLGKQLESIRE